MIDCYRKIRKNRGFTMIELMVVISIIIILASALLGSVMIFRAKSNEQKTAILLQNLVGGVETMKADYGYTRAIGVDKDGNIITIAEMDNIDIGKELDPKSPFWNPAITKADLRINGRLKTYYDVHKKQVINNTFIDPFGNPVRYRIEAVDEDVDGNGRTEHYADECLLSVGKDGTEGTEDDIKVNFPKRAFLGEDKP